jgi:hypothetical protein
MWFTAMCCVGTGFLNHQQTYVFLKLSSDSLHRIGFSFFLGLTPILIGYMRREITAFHQKKKKSVVSVDHHRSHNFFKP